MGARNRTRPFVNSVLTFRGIDLLRKGNGAEKCSGMKFARVHLAFVTVVFMTNLGLDQEVCRCNLDIESFRVDSGNSDCDNELTVFFAEFDCRFPH
jgi:hypothetical protein